MVPVYGKMQTAHSNSIERVLIYRLGSLGDTVVELPCFHAIERAFPNAERLLLTNLPVHSKAPAAYAVLAGSGLIATSGLGGQQGDAAYFRYPIGTRDVGELWRLRAEIRAWRPQALVYLTPRQRWQQVVRDVAFFRACGITKIFGAPYARDVRCNRLDAATGLYEPEAARLARTVRALGAMDLQDAKNWDLRLTLKERTRAEHVLRPLGQRPMLACSVGTKVQAKDWGAENWCAVLTALAARHAEMGLVLLGAEEENGVSELAAEAWQGRCVNLCGQLTPRESAAVLARARLFLGHDSGPMHLAAAVQTRCVAIFAARNLPEVWYPQGAGHRVLYQVTDCMGCGLETCIAQKKKCLTAIPPEAVLQAVEASLTKLHANAD